MRKTTTRRSGATVKIGRFNEPTQEVTLEEEGTVQDALNALDIQVSDAESMWVNGEQADYEDVLEDGDRLIIAGKKEGS